MRSLGQNCLFSLLWVDRSYIIIYLTVITCWPSERSVAPKIWSNWVSLGNSPLSPFTGASLPLNSVHCIESNDWSSAFESGLIGDALSGSSWGSIVSFVACEWFAWPGVSPLIPALKHIVWRRVVRDSHRGPPAFSRATRRSVWTLKTYVELQIEPGRHETKNFKACIVLSSNWKHKQNTCHISQDCSGGFTGICR